jgi:hypothetical protein
MSPEIIALSDAHALAVWRNVVIQIWERALDPATSQRELQRTLATFKRERRGSPGALLLAFSLISAHATMPDPKSRAIAAEFPSYFDYYVGVHEGAELRGSLVRTAIEAMALAARVEPRYELVDDLVGGCRRLATQSQGSVREDELRDVVLELRAQIATAGAA